MVDGYVPQNLTELIEHFRHRSNPIMWVTPREISKALTRGIPQEANMFPTFADTFSNYVERTCPNLEEKAKPRAISNLAIFSLISDHGFEDGIIEDALHGEIESALDYWRNPSKYGPAMMALSSYLGKACGEETATLLNQYTH